MKAYLEQIEAGHGEINLPFGLKLKESPDYLDIANNRLGFFSGYEQLAHFPIKRPHSFNEGEWIDVDLEDSKVVAVRKLEGKEEKTP